MNALKNKPLVNKSRHQNSFFDALGLCPAINQNHGLHIAARLRTRRAALQQQNAMPLQPHRPPLFCLISPEAYLLSGRKEKEIIKRA